MQVAVVEAAYVANHSVTAAVVVITRHFESID